MRVIKGLYGITVNGDDNVEANVAAALAGGTQVIQYRDKSSSEEEKYNIALKLKNLCRDKAIFIINDDVTLAKAVDADGVHLGKNDSDLTNARRLLGDKIIGVSCYNQLSLAEQAQAAGADYIAFGRFFTSTTKPSAVQASVDLIKHAKQSLDIPVVAIGGITVNNADTLINAGADAIAVINGLFMQPDIRQTAKTFNKLFKNLN